MLGVVIKAHASTEAQLKEELRDTIALYIIAIAEERGVDANLALRVAHCESGLNTFAVNHTSKELSVGIFQINTKVHDVTVSEAEDPVFNVNWAMNHLAEGRWKMWSCYKIV